MNLFIIGNGFDRGFGHNLPTSYGHFKKHLLDKYGAVDYLPLPPVGTAPDGGVYSNREDDAHILYKLIEDVDCNGEWKDFENDLGYISYESMVDLTPNDDDNPWHQAYNNEDSARDYSISLANIPSLFAEWIGTIDWQKTAPNENLKRLFDEGGLFLVFNYTTVLENVYGIEENRICHIHGKIGEKLIFGHANDDREFSDNLMLGEADIIFSEMHRSLRKDTATCIQENIDFLNRISETEEIYILGWSMGDSDKEYIELLKEKLKGKKVVIHFTNYDKTHDNIPAFMDKLEGLDYEVGEYISDGSLNS